MDVVVAASPPPPPASQFNGTVQVFVLLTNLSAAAAPSPGQRKLLQESGAAALDQVQFDVLVVPRPVGVPLLERPPNDLTLLFINGQAPSGYVTIFDRGMLLVNVSVTGGTGSVGITLARGPHYFVAGYSGSTAFPGSIESVVVNPDGSLQGPGSPPPQASTRPTLTSKCILPLTMSKHTSHCLKNAMLHEHSATKVRAYIHFECSLQASFQPEFCDCDPPYETLFC